VHGVAINPGDDLVYLATHDGLFRYDDTGPTRIGPVIDLMGFTVAGPNHFYASGHPGEGSDLPNPVGLITSTDAGQTWTPLSRQGQSDFHAHTTSPAGILGNDGTLRASPDGQQWTDSQIPLPPSALAARSDGRTVLAATDAGLFRSDDAARTWAPPTEAPPLKVLAWAGDGTAVGATFDGAVYVSTDTGLTWQRRGQTPPPQAISAGAEAGQVLVVTGDEVLVSADGGRTFTPLHVISFVTPSGICVAQDTYDINQLNSGSYGLTTASTWRMTPPYRRLSGCRTPALPCLEWDRRPPRPRGPWPTRPS
jgi:hypothetical protein